MKRDCFKFYRLSWQMNNKVIRGVNVQNKEVKNLKQALRQIRVRLQLEISIDRTIQILRGKKNEFSNIIPFSIFSLNKDLYFSCERIL